MNPRLDWLRKLMMSDYKRQLPADIRRQMPNPYFKAFIQPSESGVGFNSGNMKSGGSSAG